ncbi:MAG: DoxX family protein [Acidobacteriota bacterium]
MNAAAANPANDSSLNPAPLGKVRYLGWALQTVVAAILLQTLFFKFTGAPESVYIFETLGMEPFGRWGSGLAELVASVLLFIPSRRVYGALLALGVMAGAIGSHLTMLGIEVQGDGGLLFGMAVVVFASSAALGWMHRRQLPFLN